MVDLNTLRPGTTAATQRRVARRATGPARQVPAAPAPAPRATIREVPAAAPAAQVPTPIRGKVSGAPSNPTFNAHVCVNKDCDQRYRLFRASEDDLCPACGMVAGTAVITRPPSIVATMTPAREQRIARMNDVVVQPTALEVAVERLMRQMIDVNQMFDRDDVRNEPKLRTAVQNYLVRYGQGAGQNNAFVKDIQTKDPQRLSDDQIRGVLNVWRSHVKRDDERAAKQGR